MTKTPDSLSARGDIIAREANCVSCGYILKGLPESHACPECGTPVSHSLMPEALSPQSQRRLRQARRGSRFIQAWLYSLILLGLLGLLNRTMIRGVNVSGLLAMASGGVGILGFWLLTTRDPTRRRGRVAEEWRLMARYGMVVFCLLFTWRYLLSGMSPIPLSILLLLERTALLAGACGGLVVVRSLADAMQDRCLNGSARWFGSLLVPVLSLYWVSALLRALKLAQADPLIDVFTLLLEELHGLVYLPVIIWALSATRTITNQLRSVARKTGTGVQKRMNN